MKEFVRLSLENNAQCYIRVSEIIAIKHVSLNKEETIQSHIYISTGEFFKVKQTIDQINTLLGGILFSTP
ncbi:MAG: hypothetical protein JNM21_13730 [Taibaiella sp.]|nr:hypothetical protein [Taibaiella sp.]